MITAIDSSVLWAIIDYENDRANWIMTLAAAPYGGTLIVRPLVFSKFALAGENADGIAVKLGDFGIKYDPISRESAPLTGTNFRRYRTAGGPRMHRIPDFLIAAHATVQADRLACIDRGYLKT